MEDADPTPDSWTFLKLRISSIARAAAPGRMEGQPEARLSDLPGRRAGGSDEEASETGQRPAGGLARGHASERETEHGFCLRQPSRWPAVPGVDVSGSL